AERAEAPAQDLVDDLAGLPGQGGGQAGLRQVARLDQRLPDQRAGRRRPRGEERVELGPAQELALDDEPAEQELLGRAGREREVDAAVAEVDLGRGAGPLDDQGARLLLRVEELEDL